MIKNIFLKKYLSKLKDNVFYQNVAIVTSGNISAKLIGIISAPIITRLYTPEDYGVFSLFASFIGIAGSLSTLRYSATIPLAKNESLADNLLKLSFIITVVLSLWGFLIIYFLGGFITFQLSVPQLKPYLWFIPISFLGKGIYDALNNWILRYKKFKIITRTRISQSASASIFNIGLGSFGISPLGLFIGNVAQDFAGIGSFMSNLLKTRPQFFKSFSWTKIKNAAYRYKSFPLVQSWSQLLLSLGVQMPVIFLGTFYGAKVAGIFGLAQNIVNMPMDLLGQSVAQVYYAEISRFGKLNSEKIYDLSISILKKMFWIALLPILVLITLGPYLFNLVFGSEWYDAGVYAQIIAIVILFRFLSSPIMSCLNVLEKQRIQLIINILRIGIVWLVFYISKKLVWSPQKALMLYSIFMSCFYLIVIGIILKILTKQKCS